MTDMQKQRIVDLRTEKTVRGDWKRTGISLHFSVTVVDLDIFGEYNVT